jgi:uridylate kinase
MVPFLFILLTKMGLHVIAVGGSLIVPEEIDTDFLSAFKQFIIRRIEKGDRFILIAGGGKTARKYQGSAAVVSGLDNEEKDWLGIHATRINAHLLRTVFKLWAHPKLIKNYIDDLVGIDFSEKVLIGAGWKPGFSTDYDAVIIAKKFGADSIVNLSNIENVYTADPRLDAEAKKFSTITWGDYRDLVPKVWDPGMSSPIDPIAAKMADETNLKVAMVHGTKLGELNNFLDGKAISGTVISNDLKTKLSEN